MSKSDEVEQLIRNAETSIDCDCGHSFTVSGSDLLDNHMVACAGCGKESSTAPLLKQVKKAQGIVDQADKDAQERLDKMIEDFKQNQKRR